MARVWGKTSESPVGVRPIASYNNGFQQCVLLSLSCIGPHDKLGHFSGLVHVSRVLLTARVCNVKIILRS